jgi:hypothetical protein
VHTSRPHSGLEAAALPRCLQVRSVDYMRTRVKVPSSKAFYRLVAVDFFTCDTKTDHVAQLVQLPQASAAPRTIWPLRAGCSRPCPSPGAGSG